jgi:long-chain acyl-CoA synthetase
VRVYQVYGLTETTAIVTMDKPDRSSPATSATRSAAASSSSSDEGELLVRGPGVFAGYWNRPEATADAIATAGSTPAISAS